MTGNYLVDCLCYNFSDFFRYIIRLWNEVKKVKKKIFLNSSIRVHRDSNLDNQTSVRRPNHYAIETTYLSRSQIDLD